MQRSRCTDYFTTKRLCNRLMTKTNTKQRNIFFCRTLDQRQTNPGMIRITRSRRNQNSVRLQINNILSIKLAVQRGSGIAMLPDYMVDKDDGLVQLLPETEVPSFDTYFCYPDAMKGQVKLHVFRDFLISKARSWAF